MLLKHLVLGVTLAAMPLSTVKADDCSCVSSGEFAVSGVKGDVRVAGPNGFMSARSVKKLSAGARLSTGADGTVQLSGTGCSLTVAANSDVDVMSAASGGLCVAAASVTAVPQINEAAEYGQRVPSAPPLPLLVLGGGLIVAGVAAAVTDAMDDDDDASD